MQQKWMQYMFRLFCHFYSCMWLIFWGALHHMLFSQTTKCGMAVLKGIHKLGIVDSFNGPQINVPSAGKGKYICMICVTDHACDFSRCPRIESYFSLSLDLRPWCWWSAEWSKLAIKAVLRSSDISNPDSPSIPKSFLHFLGLHGQIFKGHDLLVVTLWYRGGHDAESIQNI